MGEKLLTYEGAALRVKRDPSTIKRWRREGMPMATDAMGRRVVEESVLLEEHRERLKRWPIHQQKQAKLRATDAEL